MHINSDGEISGSELCRVEVIAKLFGVTVRRIQQLTQEGIILTTESPEGRRYDLAQSVQNYTRYLSEKAHGKARSEKEMELREKKMQAEAALKESQAELHRLRTQIASGRYIALEEVRMDYERFFVVFKKFAMALPGRLTGIINGYIEPIEARRIEKDLQSEVQKLLGSFVLSAVPDDDG